MTLRFLGEKDGRWHRALRAIRKLLALGLNEADVIKLMRWHRARRTKQRVATPTIQHDLEKQERLELGQWCIRTMLSLGFGESEIAASVEVDPTTIAHALDPTEPRAMGQETILRLMKAVKGAGSERLKMLLPRVAIKVLDTCCDKGRTVDDATRTESETRARIDLQNALVFSSSPVPMVPGIHALLAQIGEKTHGLYLIKVTPGGDGTRAERIDHLRHVEHEIEHILDRFRDERKSLEIRERQYRHLPKDGSIA